MARKTKLNKQVQDKIIQSIRLGAPIELACKSGGVSKASVYRWIEKGNEQTSGIYREFCNVYKEAETACMNSMLGQIQIAASKSWQAAAWLLERRYPQNFGRVMRLEHDSRNFDAEKQVQQQRAHLRSIVCGKATGTDGKGNGKGNGNGRGGNGA